MIIMMVIAAIYIKPWWAYMSVSILAIACSFSGILQGNQDIIDMIGAGEGTVDTVYTISAQRDTTNTYYEYRSYE